ncbi:MAG TPA: helix-turn-helix transcriptional regulator, partial [Gemmatimonadaceae bacterium]|nr:helix-turn-helix transcriptional regulator [Gemmatimonadaceae bacterium]
ERHGYGIRQDVLEHTHGRIELEAGSLYRYIRHLEGDGLVETTGGGRRATSGAFTTGCRRSAGVCWRPRCSGYASW